MTSPSPERRPTGTRTAVPVWVGALALAVLGAVATFGRPYAPAVPEGPDTDLASFPAPLLAEIAAWTTPLRAGFLVATGLELLVLGVLLGTGPGRALLARLGGGPGGTLRGAVVAGALAAVVPLPVRFWVGHVVASDVGLRTGSASRWLVEWVGSTALRVVLVALGVTAAVALVRAAPRAWPAWATLLATATAVVLLLLQPVVVARVLLRPAPVQDPATLAVVDDVLDRSTLGGLDVAVGDASVRTTAVNAFVTGVGPTRTVVLLDTLLDLPADQVRWVVAHEVAHAEADDPLRGVLAVALLVLPAGLAVRAWLGRRPDAGVRHGAPLGATLVAVALVGELVTAPLVTWQSRRVEAAADARAVELTQDPAAAVGLARTLVARNLRDPAPPAWVVGLRGTHPTPRERIRAAVAAAEDPDGAPGPTGPQQEDE